MEREERKEKQKDITELCNEKKLARKRIGHLENTYSSGGFTEQRMAGWYGEKQYKITT